jgi:hypothetical protein
MIQFTPSFFSTQKGFVVNQLSGAGCPHMGNFPVLPISGVIRDSPNNMGNFDKSKVEGTIIIDSGVSSTNITNSMIQITLDKTCEDFAEGGDFCGSETNYRIYFVAEFDKSSIDKGTWIDWEDIKNGGSLNFETSKKNYKNWNLNTVSPSYQKLKSMIK